MGAAQSRGNTEEKVFHNETPIQFSQDVVNHLTDRMVSPETTPERQTTLDSHVRSRIQAELEHLRTEEDNVRKEIELALEKENLDHEMNLTGGIATGEDTHDKVMSSTALLGDLEEIRTKVDRFQTRQQLSDFPSVKESGEAVVSCYKSHLKTPLDCWREVSEFKASVAHAETQYLASLR
ncbi:hypothetical protein BV22DRAFT_1072217 [Leucogyrophana mollusca]|uniref:Uncharacterized protein n=1 Tax=Leucogyrophana mollusca TaxID=85980 RepID=A0ACB8B9P2_9AGAM|nr:hypothetical protein BV22DRAFT_1072217 [Leucogyrophana mollusca]